ncbi:MAG: FtsX-like permease family protein [Anaeroplasmataceae bacterium]
MSAYNKTVRRLIFKHKSRLISLILIVIVSVGFIFGLSGVNGKIYHSLNEYYQNENISDFYVKYIGSEYGNIDISNYDFISKIEKNFSYEVLTPDNEGVIEHIYTTFDNSINKLDIIEGKYPETENEIAVERSTLGISNHSIGDIIKIDNIDYRVVGILRNSMNFSLFEENSLLYQKPIRDIYYFNKDISIYNDFYLTLSDRKADIFSDNYEKIINEYKNILQESLGQNYIVLSLYENMSVYSLYSYGEKVSDISLIFTIFFVLVCALVVLSTMTRLLEEERSNIACMSTLGYSKTKIIWKYVLFALIASIIGSVLAYGVGMLVTKVIYIAFGSAYDMPKYSRYESLFIYFMVSLLIIVSMVAVTIYSNLKLLKEAPSNLLNPKAPKNGKKVILEKINFIWNRLSFKYKSSFRNVLRYKKHFLMTVISILGSTVLLLCGFGILDVSLNSEFSVDSFITLSICLVLFSGVLAALVIYNLTNINISERVREISTLMVLGYTDKEVAGYIYREIYIMSIIGIIIGLPVGYFLLDFVLEFISFGSVSDINWYTWIIVPICMIIFTYLITLLLKKKIVGIDMNESLKNRE